MHKLCKCWTCCNTCAFVCIEDLNCYTFNTTNFFSFSDTSNGNSDVEAAPISPSIPQSGNEIHGWVQKIEKAAENVRTVVAAIAEGEIPHFDGTLL